MPNIANPFLPQQAEAITSSMARNLNQNVLPNLRSNAASAYGFGGSRRGIAEGMATQGMQDSLAGALSNLFGGAWESDQNRGLQRDSLQTTRDLGFGNLGLNRNVANQNFYSNQRGQDLQQTQLGASLFGQGMQGLGNQGLGMYGAGQNQFNAGALPLQTYGNMLSPFTGLNSSASTTTPGASPWSSGLGGLLGGMQLANIWGRQP